MSKRLGGIKGCKYKTSSWHLNRFPDADNIGYVAKKVQQRENNVIGVRDSATLKEKKVASATRMSAESI